MLAGSYIYVAEAVRSNVVSVSFPLVRVVCSSGGRSRLHVPPITVVVGTRVAPFTFCQSPSLSMRRMAWVGCPYASLARGSSKRTNITPEGSWLCFVQISGRKVAPMTSWLPIHGVNVLRSLFICRGLGNSDMFAYLMLSQVPSQDRDGSHQVRAAEAAAGLQDRQQGQGAGTERDRDTQVSAKPERSGNTTSERRKYVFHNNGTVLATAQPSSRPLRERSNAQTQTKGSGSGEDSFVHICRPGLLSQHSDAYWNVETACNSVVILFPNHLPSSAGSKLWRPRPSSRLHLQTGLPPLLTRRTWSVP